MQRELDGLDGPVAAGYAPRVRVPIVRDLPLGANVPREPGDEPARDPFPFFRGGPGEGTLRLIVIEFEVGGGNEEVTGLDEEVLRVRAHMVAQDLAVVLVRVLRVLVPDAVFIPMLVPYSTRRSAFRYGPIDGRKTPTSQACSLKRGGWDWSSPPHSAYRPPAGRGTAGGPSGRWRPANSLRRVPRALWLSRQDIPEGGEAFVLPFPP